MRPLGELAVQQHRNPELVTEQIAEHERLGARRAPIGCVQVHDRSHIDGPDARVLPPVLGDVDRSDGCAGAGQHRRGQLAGRARRA